MANKRAGSADKGRHGETLPAFCNGSGQRWSALFVDFLVKRASLKAISAIILMVCEQRKGEGGIVGTAENGHFLQDAQILAHSVANRFLASYEATGDTDGEPPPSALAPGDQPSGRSACGATGWQGGGGGLHREGAVLGSMPNVDKRLVSPAVRPLCAHHAEGIN